MSQLSQRVFTELPPLGLYIHLPWCLKKCPYCDFNSHAIKNESIPEQPYIDALLADLTRELPDIWGRSFISVFIGGGTPSMFSPKSLDRLLSGLRALVNLHPETEITLEANPGTFEQNKFSEFRKIGINRLSIGVQSFNNNSLKALGRVHNAHEAEKSIEIARNAGFERLNLDLMFGLPEQSPEQANADISQAIELQPDHISWYQLTLEPNTLFYKHPPVTPDDEMLWDMQAAGINLLNQANYSRYEVSAFAQPGQESVHNINYWTFGDYLGIGAGAHGKISFPSDGNIIRRMKSRHPTDYLRKAHSSERLSSETPIPVAETALEFMMNALRLHDGFEKDLFERRTGIPLLTINQELQEARDLGLILNTEDRLQPTELGYDHLNTLLEMFMARKPKPFFPIREL